MVFPLAWLKEKKRISEKHTEIFLEFLFFWGKKNKNEKNYLHGKAPNKGEKSFWVFFLITTTSMESKLAKSYN